MSWGICPTSLISIYCYPATYSSRPAIKSMLLCIKEIMMFTFSFIWSIFYWKNTTMYRWFSLYCRNLQSRITILLVVYIKDPGFFHFHCPSIRISHGPSSNTKKTAPTLCLGKGCCHQLNCYWICLYLHCLWFLPCVLKWTSDVSHSFYTHSFGYHKLTAAKMAYKT